MRASLATITGFATGAACAVWFFLMSGLLGATPTDPVGNRVDVFFQCDAARHVDAAYELSRQYGASHPLLRFFYAYPIHLVAHAVAEPSQERVVAMYLCRAYVAIVAGFGIGCLAGALVCFGVRPLSIAILGPLLILGSGQTIASLPDHYGLSFGLLSWAFAIYLSGECGGRYTVGKLLLATFFLGGVTITNAALPLLLLAVRWIRREVLPGWFWIGVALVAVSGGVASLIVLRTNTDAMPWHVRTFLNWRLVDAPKEAAARMIRGSIDPIIGPTPAIDTNNLPQTPMLTYEPRWRGYSAWPYDRSQSPAAILWVVLLAFSIARVVTQRADRWIAGPLLVWVFWNFVFHNIWGDEFFLYTSHYSWAIWAVAVIGLRRQPLYRLLLPVAAVTVGQLYTLWLYRAALAQLPTS